MGYRRHGKQSHEERKAWRAWLEDHAELVDAAKLPPEITDTEQDWVHFMTHGYPLHPDCAAWFHVEELEPDRMTSLLRLARAWRTDHCPETPELLEMRLAYLLNQRTR